MKPTDELSRDHEVMLRMIRILGEMADRLDAGVAVDPADLDQAVTFVRSFSDKCHHTKEESHLYAEILRSGAPDERGAIELMIAEHAEARKCVAAMTRAIEGLRQGDALAAQAFAAAASNYNRLLSEHIYKEDHVLYPTVRTRLTHAQQTALKVRFAEVDKECLGPGKREEFDRLLRRLEQAYPE